MKRFIAAIAAASLLTLTIVGPVNAGNTLINVTGNGVKSSRPFTAPNQWKISYTFNCASSGMGGRGNFIIYVWQGSTPLDTAANRLAKKGHGSSWEYQGGKHIHLEMNSECSWHVWATRH